MVDAAVEKLQSDLDWRGPSGKPMGIITMPRDMAEVVLGVLRENSQKYGSKNNPDNFFRK
jgi:hypothetical protein